MHYATNYETPLGEAMLASDGEHITGLWLNGQKYHGGTGNDILQEDDLPIFAAAKDWLDRYFCGEKPAIAALPLAPAGGAFRREVWRILCEIPYGGFITYGDIAKQIAEKMHKSAMSAQAVGGAVGHNPISIIIPCHRVVGANGNLTGYAGGLDKKVFLLEHEGVDMSQFFVPTRGTAL